MAALARPASMRRSADSGRTLLRAAAGPHACARRGRRRSATPLQAIFAGAAFAADRRRVPAHPQRGAARPRLGGAAHARRRRQRAHQHPGQQRQLRDAADRARGGGAHHGAGAQPRRRDLGRARHRHHQARVPDRRRDRATSPTTSSASIPKGRFNKGKLLRDARSTARRCKADLTNAYTPSFGLMGHESLIMQQSDIGAIADSIKDCLRCGKCKPVVRDARAARQPAVQPAQQDPRDLAAGRGLPLRGADAARRQSITHWEEFEDVADHCTVCHKCLSAVPGRTSTSATSR